MEDTTPAPLPRARLRQALRPGLTAAGLLVVFAWLLPQFIDYEEVWDALKELDAREAIVLLGLGIARVPTEALMYRAFLPGLGLWRGSEAYLSSNFAGQLLPPPSASAVQYGYFRGAGYDSLAITAIAAITGFYFLRRERSARWLGAKVQRPLSWTLVKLRRDRIEDGAEKAAELRRRAPAILREGSALGAAGVAANLFVTYLILLAALRFLGLSATELSAAEVFAAFAIAFWAGAVFPITGSGLGVVDAVLIAMLIELSSASDDTLLAAALL